MEEKAHGHCSLVSCFARHASFDGADSHVPASGWGQNRQLYTTLPYTCIYIQGCQDCVYSFITAPVACHCCCATHIKPGSLFTQRTKQHAGAYSESARNNSIHIAYIIHLVIGVQRHLESHILMPLAIENQLRISIYKQCTSLQT